MALKLTNYTTEHGVILEEAYCRIDVFRGDRRTIHVSVGFYSSEQARLDEKPPVEVHTFTMPTPNTESNMFACAYVWLKEQPIFYNSVDV